MNAGVGDQIHLKGMLINYSPRAHSSRSRNSSLVRTDTGNGACEVVFVEEFEVTKAHKPFWRKVDRVGRSMFWIFLILIPLARFMSGILRYQQQKKALEFALERKRRRKEALSRIGARQRETVSEP